MATSTISLDAAGFSSALNDLADHVRGEVSAVIRKACIDLYRRIVERTPRDTGRARASWQLSTTGQGSNVWQNRGTPGVLNSAASASDIANNINQNVSEFKVDIHTDTVTIYNNLEYISILEAGRQGNRGSLQAPTGMVAISLSEFEQHFRNALAGMNL